MLMKKSHLSNDYFSETEVRLALRRGIERAKRKTVKMNNKPNRLLKVLIYSLTVAAAMFLILLGSSYLSPSLANNLAKIPLIGSVFGQSDDIRLQKAQNEGLSTAL